MNRKIWGIFLLAATLLLTAGCYKIPVQPETTPASEQTTLPEATTELPTETTPPPTEPVITAPEALVALLEANGSDLQQLTRLGCTQLVTVAATGTSAQIDLYILENYQWTRQETLSCNGYVGSNGTTDQKREGDKATPKGLFPIDQAFYIHEAPQTGLPVFQITEETYWIDDPASVYYNKRVEGVEHKDWSSAEHMIRYGAAYEYGFVIGYNPNAIPYAGSAIFFHVGNRTTSGCVATDKAFVLQYLAAIRASENPYILIQTTPSFT